ncbi:MAG: cytochrome b/b6 domain-containing protein [Actinomycetota bacterium]|nr:cytochrome b/b6 domain-containing protein [Actinomycetota bacterium]
MSEDMYTPEAKIDVSSIPKDAKIRRFGPVHRIMHGVLIVAINIQFFTGIPLRYRNAGWAQWMFNQVGGVPVMGLLHRIGGVAFLLVVLMHAAWLIYYVFIKKGQWYGDTSILFRLEDLYHVVGNIKYMLGRGPEPKFGRYNYWEKFDWMAVFWGSMIIGATGAAIMAKNYLMTLNLLPKQFYNVATILHSDEAVLAMGFLYVAHWYGAHWNPAKFPINTVVFTGIETREELEDERPGEWELLEKDPKWLKERLIEDEEPRRK